MKQKIRKLVKPRDLNTQNALFGGQLLKWIDEEIGVFAINHLEARAVATKYLSEINFRSLAFQGDMIEIEIKVMEYGTTSINLQVAVENLTKKKIILYVSKVVMVNVDENYRPVPHGKSFSAEKI